VAELAAEIIEVRRVLQVVSQSEARLTAGAAEQRRQRVTRWRPLFVQSLEDLEDAAGGKLHALERVEPNDLTGEAEVDGDRANVQTLELERLHSRPAAGAVRHPVTIDRRSGGAELRSDTAWGDNQDLVLVGRTCGQFTQYRAVRVGCHARSIRSMRA
jgi:hypothetical protein